ncbi:NADH-ubiquinone oxidoreductase-F iron-sulfur binding region domain-containing protein [Streptomyces sp. NPDC002730]|uniref:NADH-ubiquinone oxidoreductase-F iron-sulfur binding region domain-containing protein n=1 Tax=Streptomyces sp. NPDC002730 TaxID=3364662 RepID=UPI0036AA715A
MPTIDHRPGVHAPRRLLPPHGGDNLAAHMALHGVPPYESAAALTGALRDAGLNGHGGAGFPVHLKLAAVAEAARRTRRTPVVVANGAEGEPASAKDLTLLLRAPHLVLDGAQLAARVVGADRMFLAVGGGEVIRVLRVALGERERCGLDPLPVRMVEIPARFLSGQSSALVAYLNGRPALPRHPEPPVREQGVGRAPTLVQNVETLAHLALVARYGAEWFRSVGTVDEPGSMLCTVHTAGRPPQVAEVALGTPLARLLPMEHGAVPAQAVLVGGYHGAWIPAADAARLRLSSADLQPYGAALGAGVLATLPANRCGLAESARVLRYLALESAGQCGPCLNGLPRIAIAFAELARPGCRPGTHADIERWAGLVEGRGACHHPDGTVRLVRSALIVFAAEADRHVRGRCAASDPRPLLPVPMPVEEGN